MRRIAVINQKGGVGKTTTAANLGAAMAQTGLRVLLIDLDPQGHLTLHFGAEVSDGQPSVYDVLTGGTPIGEATLPVRERITLVPADIDLAAADAELISVTGREVLLREALEPIEDDHDVMLIDCAPSLGVLTINALAAADEVLIPLQAHFFGLQGLGKLLETVTLVRQRINPKLEVGGVVLCMHESATRLSSEVADEVRRFIESGRGGASAWSRAKIYDTCIRRNIKLAESSSFGQTVFDYAPKSNGAVDYARLAAEVLEQPTDARMRYVPVPAVRREDSREDNPPEPPHSCGEESARHECRGSEDALRRESEPTHLCGEEAASNSEPTRLRGEEPQFDVAETAPRPERRGSGGSLSDAPVPVRKGRRVAAGT